jgi:hypothetical protein
MSDISGSVEEAIEAQAQAVRATRRNLISKLREERRAHEEARERAEQARERFERTVALLASERPGREDWHAFPGALTREELLNESGLSTQQLHRLMEHQRRPPATRRSRP